MSKLRILVAYPYMKENAIQSLQDIGGDLEFLLDSGAFTAWKAGKEINVDDYCNFIEKLPITPWRYFNLDKIGDPHGSMENYQTMIKRGFKPLPVFTRGESVDYIDEYYKTSDVLGIGGLVGTKGNKGFVKGVMKHIGNRKVHWLGFTSSDYVNHYKPYMCDCSSWSYATRYGDLQLYIGQGKIKSIHRKEFYKKPDDLILNTISSYGVDPKLLAKEESWRSPNNTVHKLVAQSWVRRSLQSFDKLDTRLFLAAASAQDVKILHEGFLKEIK